MLHISPIAGSPEEKNYRVQQSKPRAGTWLLEAMVDQNRLSWVVHSPGLSALAGGCKKAFEGLPWRLLRSHWIGTSEFFANDDISSSLLRSVQYVQNISKAGNQMTPINARSISIRYHAKSHAAFRCNLAQSNINRNAKNDKAGIHVFDQAFRSYHGENQAGPDPRSGASAY